MNEALARLDVLLEHAKEDDPEDDDDSVEIIANAKSMICELYRRNPELQLPRIFGIVGGTLSFEWANASVYIGRKRYSFSHVDSRNFCKKAAQRDEFVDLVCRETLLK